MHGIAWDISVTGFLDLSSGVLLGIFLSSAEITLGIFMELSSEVLFGIRLVAVAFLEYCLDFPRISMGWSSAWNSLRFQLTLAFHWFWQKLAKTPNACLTHLTWQDSACM